MMSYFTRNQLQYGLLTTGIMTICLNFMYFSNKSFENSSPIELIFMTLMPLIVLFFGINAYKKSQKKNLTLREGVLEGFKISLVHALVSPFVFVFFYLFVNASLLEYARNTYGMTKASMQSVIYVDMLVQFIGVIIVGAFYSLIASYLLKTRRK